MTALLTMLLPAFAAPIADGIKAITRKYSGVSVDDEIKLLSANTEKVKAIAELDRPAGNISPWVANLRASFRYLCAGIIVLTACGAGIYAMVGVPDLRAAVVGAFLELTGAAFSFIFGERMYLGLKGQK